MKAIHIKSASFQDAIWPEIRAIRDLVFIQEQAVSEEEEYDEYEAVSRHFCAYVVGKPAGTARWRRTEKGIKLERFAVLKESRKLGVGRALVGAVLQDVFQQEAAPGSIYLHAQLHAIPFYEKSGFEAFGDIFSEADILHRIMYFTGEAPEA
jgi:predicted GNAT family N-acyltransferase